MNEEWLSSVSVSELTTVNSHVITAFTSKQLMCSMSLPHLSEEKNVDMNLIYCNKTMTYITVAFLILFSVLSVMIPVSHCDSMDNTRTL